MESPEQRFRLRLRLPFQAGGHQRSRGFGNSAARTLEADIPDHIPVQLYVDDDLVAAERVVTFRLPVRRFQDLEVARLLVMVENDFLIEILQIRHQPNTSMTLWMPAARAWISSRVL